MLIEHRAPSATSDPTICADGHVPTVIALVQPRLDYGNSVLCARWSANLPSTRSSIGAECSCTANL